MKKFDEWCQDKALEEWRFKEIDRILERVVPERMKRLVNNNFSFWHDCGSIYFYGSQDYELSEFTGLSKDAKGIEHFEQAVIMMSEWFKETPHEVKSSKVEDDAGLPDLFAQWEFARDNLTKTNKIEFRISFTLYNSSGCKLDPLGGTPTREKKRTIQEAHSVDIAPECRERLERLEHTFD